MNCLVCQVPLKGDLRRAHSGNTVYKEAQCPNCGVYGLTDEALEFLNEDRNLKQVERARLSHDIWKAQKSSQVPVYFPDFLKSCLTSGELPNIVEQTTNLILHLGETLTHYADTYRTRARNLRASIGAINDEEVELVLSHLIENKLVLRKQLSPSPDYVLKLTFDGWTEYEERKRKFLDSKIAFLAMEYGDPELERIAKDHLKPAVGKTGFKLYDLRDNQKADLIDNRLRSEIRKARFLIVDLTHHNRGAYWEAGFAEGLNRPVFYICRKDVLDSAKTHFDVSHSLILPWKKEEMKSLEEQLKSTIRATLPGDSVMND